MIMKYSYYNLVYYDDQYSYWFNTLHRTFFRLSRELGHKLEGFSANLASLKSECYDIIYIKNWSIVVLLYQEIPMN